MGLSHSSQNLWNIVPLWVPWKSLGSQQILGNFNGSYCGNNPEYILLLVSQIHSVVFSSQQSQLQYSGNQTCLLLNNLSKLKSKVIRPGRNKMSWKHFSLVMDSCEFLHHARSGNPAQLLWQEFCLSAFKLETNVVGFFTIWTSRCLLSNLELYHLLCQVKWQGKTPMRMWRCLPCASLSHGPDPGLLLQDRTLMPRR